MLCHHHELRRKELAIKFASKMAVQCELSEEEGGMLSMKEIASLEQQYAVQRKLGRCLLRLQQYEMLLKVLVTHSEIEGPNAQLEALRDKKAFSVQKMTMGALVGMLTESYLSPEQETEGPDKPVPGSGGPWTKMRFQAGLSPEQSESAGEALDELVKLRNELVHHFLQLFDVWKADGCVAAEAYLDNSYETIDGHFITLRGWAQSMEQTRAMLASFTATSAFENILVHGIMPDGSVIWPMSGAVSCLREAESKFAIDGWVKLNTATAWIRDEYAEQQPQR
ncbi:hypothetical protein GCM10010970_37970 [Silvimonas iriomotensis]|uniref:HTH OST-type domain-containing protein n=2 Tax=Silvimonas iriomotensis TaxID=449662 RepID=A0ABQ2PEV6_9NEIS|nr:hypothetical protein GCM10010970_37970 [Silvimonas iriomotensis]